MKQSPEREIPIYESWSKLDPSHQSSARKDGRQDRRRKLHQRGERHVMGKPAWADGDGSSDARRHSQHLSASVEKVNGELWNVELTTVENIKDPVKAARK